MSTALMPTQMMWSPMRASSETSTRISSARLGMRRSSSFSTAWA